MFLPRAPSTDSEVLKGKGHGSWGHLYDFTEDGGKRQYCIVGETRVFALDRPVLESQLYHVVSCGLGKVFFSMKWREQV